MQEFQSELHLYDEFNRFTSYEVDVWEKHCSIFSARILYP